MAINEKHYVKSVRFYFLRLSFALAASKLKEKARIVAMDLRGHGKSATQNDVDLSIEVLLKDVSYYYELQYLMLLRNSFFPISMLWWCCWLQTLCGDVFSVLKTMYGDAPPAIVLVGHRLYSLHEVSSHSNFHAFV